MPLLEVEDLVVRYGAVEAVHGITLTVGTGELVALLGANGAGKSSTLLGITGLQRPAGGVVRFDGVVISGETPDVIARRRISLTPEGRRIFSDLTVLENLTLGGAVAFQGAMRAQKIDEMFARFPVLADRRQQKAGSLSGGEQQMLAIGRSLMSEPRLLLLDEPSLGLAPQMIDVVYDIIEALRPTGLSILLVEQNVALALDVADRGYVLANGRVVLEGPAAELRDSALIRSAYLETA
jgi:branched-chain amino acid transport system ATP-binding protein